MISLSFSILPQAFWRQMRGGIPEESTGLGYPEGALRESQEGSQQISLVSATLGSKTWQDAQGGQQRKTEKGSWLWA